MHVLIEQSQHASWVEVDGIWNSRCKKGYDLHLGSGYLSIGYLANPNGKRAAFWPRLDSRRRWGTCPNKQSHAYSTPILQARAVSAFKTAMLVSLTSDEWHSAISSENRRDDVNCCFRRSAFSSLFLRGSILGLPEGQATPFRFSDETINTSHNNEGGGLDNKQYRKAWLP